MNRVIHFEIYATDTKKAASFYRDVFGWDIQRWDNPNVDYWVVMTAPEGSQEPGIDGGISGRVGPSLKGDEPPSSFVCTIHVPSVDEYIKKIESHGGTLALPKMPIPGTAWLAYCKDIEGNLFGIFEDDKNAG